jgi:hypothetical protein
MDIETGFRTTMHTFSTKDTHKLEDKGQSKPSRVNREREKKKVGTTEEQPPNEPVET